MRAAARASGLANEQKKAQRLVPLPERRIRAAISPFGMRPRASGMRPLPPVPANVAFLESGPRQRRYREIRLVQNPTPSTATLAPFYVRRGATFR